MGCASTDPASHSAKVYGLPFHLGEESYYMQIPSTPSGCETRIFHIGPNQFPAELYRKTDWTPYLRDTCGMIFPRGGFAAYYAPCQALIIASTSSQLDLMEPVGSR